jgi:HD-GYP domain-containing protein (c-di-GMP phosphodiesterase class II)
VGVVDAFDAMTHERPYSRALSMDQALEELRRGSGRQFDPDLVAVFLGLLHQELSDPNAATQAAAIPAARVIDIPRLTVGTVRSAGTDAVGEPIGP